MQPDKITFDQLDYTLDLDDRVVCNGCPHRIERMDKESVHMDRARTLEAAGKRIGFDGDRIEQQGDWLVISWRTVACRLGQHQDPTIHPMPDGVLHRCRFIKPPGYEQMHHPEKTLQQASNPAQTASEDWWT